MSIFRHLGHIVLLGRTWISAARLLQLELTIVVYHTCVTCSRFFQLHLWLYLQHSDFAISDVTSSDACGTHHVMNEPRPSVRISYCKRRTRWAWERGYFQSPPQWGEPGNEARISPTHLKKKTFLAVSKYYFEYNRIYNAVELGY